MRPMWRCATPGCLSACFSSTAAGLMPSVGVIGAVIDLVTRRPIGDPHSDVFEPCAETLRATRMSASTRLQRFLNAVRRRR